VPRAGLDPATVVAAGAALADEVGFTELTMGRLAERVGVRAPSLYKHIASQDDLHRRIAALTLAEAADAIGAATQGRAGRDALAAAARALRDFVLTHPGRYAATIGLTPTGPDDPIAVAEMRALGPFEAVLRGYDIAPQEMTHALRALRSAFHGFATLQATGGFQWSTDSDESFEWLIDLVDRGLRSASVASPASVPGPAGHR
jgi:AcrR family transcriptional regulator